jgi:hypothetical protein
VSGFTTDSLEVLDITNPTEPVTVTNLLTTADGSGG